MCIRDRSYSVGFTLPTNTPDLLAKIPEHAWSSAYDAHDQVRDGAWVAELTGLLDLSRWPTGMRVIVRKERPHPGAQLRFDDVDGMRITAFVTNTSRGQLPDLELRHRRRALCEDRIRIAKDIPAWSTCRCIPLRPTRSGAPSSRSPWTSPPGCRPSPSPATTPAAGNPNDYATASSASRPASPAPPARPCCICPTGPPGPRSPSTPSTDSTSCRRPADPAAIRPDQPHHPDPWNPAPRDDNGPTVIPLRQNQTNTVILKPSQRLHADR